MTAEEDAISSKSPGQERTRETFSVSSTSGREFEKEYIVQFNERVLREQFPETSNGDFVLVQTDTRFPVGVHAKVKTNNELDDRTVGLDFTLRTAIGAPSSLEVKHGRAEKQAEVTVEPITNPEQSVFRRTLNRFLGVRPQICRVRMGVFPDLEDKVCRLPSNTHKMIGIDEGDNVTIESAYGDRIIRGLKSFEINEERREKKEIQKTRDEKRYPSCEELLELDKIRRTEVDIPEIWIDEETRAKLGMQSKPNSGVCQPVRVYRDSRYLFKQRLREFSLPLVFVLVASGFEFQDSGLTVLLWVVALIIWVLSVVVSTRSRLW